MLLEEAAEICKGSLHPAPDSSSSKEPSFEGLKIDNRTISPGNAFLALRGERFDGHDFAAGAAENGANVLFVEEQLSEVCCAQIVVEDTVAALGALAQAWRREVAPRTVAITGSVGKTTTKELLGQILERTGSTHVTPGNYNNHIGLPLTLLGMPRNTRFLIAEMGMNAPGEIAELALIAEPEVGVITAIAPVHLEGLGTLEAVAAAKAELFEALKGDHHAIFPADEPLLAPHLAPLKARRVTFGEGVPADIRLLDTQSQGMEGSTLCLALGEEQLEVNLPLVGRHNARNAACAAATAFALGLTSAEIIAGLEAPPRLVHRSSLRQVGPFQVYDDSYNASPTAVRAALDTLLELAAGGPCWAVLGEMRELGNTSVAHHHDLGVYAAHLGLSGLITTGGEASIIARGAREAGMAPSRVHAEGDPEAAGRRLVGCAESKSWVLFKGSRGARVERALESVEREVGGPSKS